MNAIKEDPANTHVESMSTFTEVKVEMLHDCVKEEDEGVVKENEDVDDSIKNKKTECFNYSYYNVKQEVVESNESSLEDAESSEASCSLGGAACIKQELDIGPIELQPPKMQLIMRPCKLDPDIDKPAMPIRCSTQDRELVGGDSTQLLDIDVSSVNTPSIKLAKMCKRTARNAEKDEKIDPKTALSDVPICSVQSFFSSSDELKASPSDTKNDVHMQTVTDDCTSDTNVFECDYCQKVFGWKYSLLSHMHNHLNQPNNPNVIKKKFEIPLGNTLNVGCKKNLECCIQVSKKSVLSRSHQCSVSEKCSAGSTQERPYKCTVCDKSFSYCSSLTVHMRVHTKERPYQCTVCEKSFTRSNHITEHMRMHTKERPYKCTVCEKSFNGGGDLTRHLRVHTKERPYQCTICEKSFTQNSHFTRHLRAHTKERPYQCTDCKASFSKKISLTKHIMRIHTKEHPFTCNICEKSFTHNTNLTVHMRVHTKERPYQCTICKKSFSCSSYLRIHKRVHTKERPYQCTVCKQSFTQNSHFTRHMRAHTKERPYRCTVCEKSYVDNGSLTVHMRLHTKERPYQCTVCEKSFGESGSFSVHLRVHTKERPYQCTVCEKSFTQSSNLTSHMRVHTKERPYQCTVCEKSFSKKVSLTKHIIRVHTEDRP